MMKSEKLLVDSFKCAESGLDLSQVSDLDLVCLALDKLATLVFNLEQLMLRQRLIRLITSVRQRVMHGQLLSQHFHLIVQLLHHSLSNPANIKP